MLGGTEMLVLAVLGGPEMLGLLAVVVLLFGAKKLPELASSMGKSIKEFRKATEEEVAAESADDDSAA